MIRDRADVVVTGGGIIGAAAAFALAQEKLDVVLLERGSLAGGASGNSFAWINATAKTTDTDYHRLNAAGVDAYHAFAAEHGAEAIGLFGHGDLRWAEPADPESVEHLDRTAGRLGELGYPVERVDRRG
ncbi:MAG: FAD-dependent oxidoreductase, partial [Alphaproteobacteria bacterium]